MCLCPGAVWTGLAVPSNSPLLLQQLISNTLLLIHRDEEL